ncbi:hypothetical protein [Brucella anthropi]|uniref:hypothetical protein n=1 Tax=Brucella anthropi TaxID=529 RepID=UPI003D96EFDE
MLPVKLGPIPDGLYRMEFTAGEKWTNNQAQLLAQIISGAEIKKGCGEVIATSHLGSADVDAAAIMTKTEAYLKLFGIEHSCRDKALTYEDFLYRPFFADVRGNRIVAIANDTANPVLLPAAGRSVDPEWDVAKQEIFWRRDVRVEKAA